MNEKSSADWQQLDALLSSLMKIHELSCSYLPADGLSLLCNEVLKNACALVNSGRGSLMLYDESTGRLRVAASMGLDKKSCELRLRPGEGAAGKVFETGRHVVISNPRSYAGFVQSSGKVMETEPFIAMPLKANDRVLGVLNLHSSDIAALSSEYNIKLLYVLTGKAAITIDNMRLYGIHQNFCLEMVETLSRVIDAKDSYTHDHAGRARQKARDIARRMNLPEEQLRNVEFAALLHDIGKIGISETLLRKPGRLTPDEYEEIKKHPAIGYQILAPVAFLAPVAKMVLYHQEWFNGDGYPKGLSGEAIPLGARIVSAIDAWDAMVSDRPYRKALSRKEAIVELKKGSGSQFDPGIIDVFLMLEEKEWRSGNQNNLFSA